jgi:hypothetical protein
MSNQNFKNHSRYIVLFHFVTPAIIVAIIIGSIINLVTTGKENLYSASLLVAIALLLPIFWLYPRYFALRVQDRAIRAEENFRHFVLTGKPFDNRIRMSQVIALRFASDQEFPALTQKAVNEGLKSNEIKKAITNWRVDRHRA